MDPNGSTITMLMPCHRQHNNDCAVYTLQHMEALYRNRATIQWDKPSTIHVNDYIPPDRAGPAHMDQNRKDLYKLLDTLERVPDVEDETSLAVLQDHKFLLTTSSNGQ